jgi:hypothetical protein
MTKKRKISKKEKREILLIGGAVFLVLIIGLAITLIAEKRVEAISGEAIKLIDDMPSYYGEIILFKNYCENVQGNGDKNCNEICEAKTCVPVEENCDEMTGNNSCFCCLVE